MATNPIGNTQNQPAVSTPLAGNADADQPGNIGKGKSANGENLTVVHQASALNASMDIAEEMSQALTKFKKLEKREVDQGKSQQENLEELLKRIQSVEPIDGLDELTDSIMQGSGSTFNRKDLRKDAEERFPDDVFHQFVALYQAAFAFESINGRGSAEHIFAAADDIKEDNKQAILIGLNLTEEAAKLSEEYKLMTIPETRKEYQRAVQDHVEDHKTLSHAYREINTRHGSGNFEKAVDIQLKLLGADLACVEQSTSDTRLKAIMDDMQKLKVLAAAHDNCIETQERIGRDPHNIELNAPEYLGSILNMVSKQFVTSSDFIELAKNMGVSELPDKTFFMNQTSEAINMLPEGVFINSESKQQLLSAVQEVKDSLALEEAGEDQSADIEDGIVGEVNIGSTGILDDIAHQMGYDLSGSFSDDKIPGVLKNTKTPEAKVDEKVDVGSSSLDSSAVKATNAKTVNAGDETSIQASELDSYAGLSDKKLVEIQDEKLKRAGEIFQQNGEKFVMDNAQSTLERALENGPEAILKTLKHLSDQRGSSVAKDLKVSIKPDGSTQSISLIPPKDLKNKTPEELKELLETAINVLKEDRVERFKNVDFEKLNNELNELKKSIRTLDNNMKTKSRKRSKGEKQYQQLEQRRVFIRSTGVHALVTASNVSDDENTLKIGKSDQGASDQSPSKRYKISTDDIDSDDSDSGVDIDTPAEAIETAPEQGLSSDDITESDFGDNNQSDNSSGNGDDHQPDDQPEEQDASNEDPFMDDLGDSP